MCLIGTYTLRLLLAVDAGLRCVRSLHTASSSTRAVSRRAPRLGLHRRRAARGDMYYVHQIRDIQKQTTHGQTVDPEQCVVRDGSTLVQTYFIIPFISFLAASRAPQFRRGNTGLAAAWHPPRWCACAAALPPCHRVRKQRMARRLCAPIHSGLPSWLMISLESAVFSSPLPERTEMRQTPAASFTSRRISTEAASPCE